MALWFMDSMYGDDGNDGQASIAFNASVGFSRDRLSLSSPGLFPAVSIGAMLTISSGLNSAWFRVSSGDDDTIYGELVNESGTIGSGTVLLGGASSGPVKTLSAMQALMSPGDIGYIVQRSVLLREYTPATSPVSEIVALALKARLETITVANGYTIDVGQVLRVPLVAIPIPQDLQVVMIQAADRKAEESAAFLEHRDLEFTLGLTMRAGESDNTALDAYANRFHAAVRKALLADVTLGGVCIDLIVGDYEQLENEMAIAVYALNVTARYRHKDDNPYPL